MTLISIILIVFFVLSLIALLILILVLSMRNRVVSGKEGMIDETGVALNDFDEKGRGSVRVHGEIWNARSEQPIRKDDEVKVIEVEKLYVTVKKLEA